MSLLRLLFRRPEGRHPFRDGASPVSSFVTLCTKFRVNYFGDIVNGRIDLSPVGKIAEFELGKTMRTADHVLVDSWTIMPNHIHIIFRILPQKPSPGYRSGRHPGNLPVIIREFKSAVKRWTNLYGFEFRWQARYHDHRVRNDRELERIRWYIRNNARVWPSDSMNR